MDLYGKFFAFVAAVIFFISGVGPVIGEFDAEPSTKLTQTEMVGGELPCDLQLKPFYDNSEEGFIIPGLKEGFVPQGIFYEEVNDIFLLSGYYKGKAQPSRVIVVDGEGNLVKSVGCLTQKGDKATGHFGGIAVYKDYVYVATTSVTHVLSLTEVLSAEDEGYVQIKTGIREIDAMISILKEHYNKQLEIKRIFKKSYNKQNMVFLN